MTNPVSHEDRSKGGGADQETAPEAAGIAGSSGKVWLGGAPPHAPGMPEPTTVSQVRDGHPRGRHMIDAFRMMATAARTSRGKHQKEMAEVYDLAALCIENEARRADRAEVILRELGHNGVPRGNGS